MRTKPVYHIYSNARQGFSLNMALKYVRSSQIHVYGVELDCAKTDSSEPDNAEPNQCLYRQSAM